MSSNIDRSLDEIIKEQRKLKKKTQKQKTQQAQKKGAQQRQGKKQTKVAAAKQNQRWRTTGKQSGQSVQKTQGTQGRRRAVGGKQSGQLAKQRQGNQGQKRTASGRQQARGGGGGGGAGRGGGNQNTRKNRGTGNTSGGARVTANRLRNKQGSLQKTKQIISKAKKVQQNNRPKNRLNRQSQQRDARQNIINIRRGMQGQLKGNRQNKAQNSRNIGTPKLQKRNSRRGIQSPQLTVSINNPKVRLTRTPQWKQVSNQQNNQNRRRGWRGRGRVNASLMGPTEDLRISVPNNLHQPAPLKPFMYGSYDIPVNPAVPGRTYATLNERFSSMQQTERVRTIFVD